MSPVHSSPHMRGRPPMDTLNTMGYRQHWLREIDKGKIARERWLVEAKRAWETFRNERRTVPNTSMDQSSSREGEHDHEYQPDGSKPINIFAANCLIQEAAVFSQLPIPQVRKRIGIGDHNEREAADILQRCLTYALDAQQPSLMKVLKRIRRDFVVGGFGMAEVEFHQYGRPRYGDDRPLPVMRGDNNQWVTPDGVEIMPQAVEESEAESNTGLYYPERAPVFDLEDEIVQLSYTNPMDVLVEPAATWEDAQWVAVLEKPTRAEVEKRFGRDAAERLRYDGLGESDTDRGTMEGIRMEDDDEPSPFARARIWRVFDRERRLVIWIEDESAYTMGDEESIDHDMDRDDVLAIAEDERDLPDFLPFPMPLCAGMSNEEIWGQPELEQYDQLYEMLQKMGYRWFHLVDAIRQKMFVSSALETLDPFKAGKDTLEVVPVTDAVPDLDLAKHIAWMPIGEIVNASNAIYNDINALLQLSHQVSGIPDLWRGVSKPRTTATAEQHKVEFGAGRVDEKRREFSEFCRDWLRMMASIVCSKFRWETIIRMASVKLPPLREVQDEVQKIQKALTQIEQGAAQQEGQDPAQIEQQAQQLTERLEQLSSQPTEDEVEKLLRTRMLRDYAIDIETDSTVAGEADFQRQARAEMLETMVRAADALERTTASGAIPPDAITELFISILRGIPFTRELVRKLEQWTPPPPPEPPPSDAQIRAEAEQAMQEQQLAFQAMDNEKERELKARVEHAKGEITLELEKLRQAGQAEQVQQKLAADVMANQEQSQAKQTEQAMAGLQDMAMKRQEGAAKEKEIAMKGLQDQKMAEIQNQEKQTEIAMQGLQQTAQTKAQGEQAAEADDRQAKQARESDERSAKQAEKQQKEAGRQAEAADKRKEKIESKKAKSDGKKK